MPDKNDKISLSLIPEVIVKISATSVLNITCNGWVQKPCYIRLFILNNETKAELGIPFDLLYSFNFY